MQFFPRIKNNIHLLGLRPDAVSLIKGSNLYVQTSLSEGFGRAISEAMSVGKPIMADLISLHHLSAVVPVLTTTT